MTDKACGTCLKRHPAGARLECRARPPIAAEGGFGRWPLVAADGYCHSDYEPEAAPAPARARRAQSDAPVEGKLL